MFARKKDLKSANIQIDFLWKRVQDLERSRNLAEKSYSPQAIPEATREIGCVGCKVMDAAMRVMSALQFGCSNGTEAMGIEFNFRSALAFDRYTQEIIINEEELMQAIIFANPGQKRRKLRLVSEEEFEQYKKRRLSKEPTC